ncbi:MAG: helix-turn-helix domain-containing protein [Dehalococcoidia bacterium]
MPSRPKKNTQPADPTAEGKLVTLLKQLHTDSGLSYEQIAERAYVSRSTVSNYLNTPAGRPVETLRCLLDAMQASPDERKRALDLHAGTFPNRKDPAELDWRGRAEAAGLTVWPMEKFTPSAAVVHTAIGRRLNPTEPPPNPDPDQVPPAYVERAHDAALRRDIAAAVAGDLRALIVLRGTSSTGKTRSLFEAVHQLCPGWTVIRPHDAAALRGLPETGLLDRRLVVWLNELQGFLGSNGTGLSVPVLDRLFAVATRPLVLVGTLWPDKLQKETDHRDESRSDTRELLKERRERVRWHEVPRTLTTDRERAEAERLAETDPRLTRALADQNRFGFAQTLAGAHELLEHYTNAGDATPARLLLDAAADARRLGHKSALTVPLLRALTLAAWRDIHASARIPVGWFDTALTQATQTLPDPTAPDRGERGIQALIPIEDPSLATTAPDPTDDASDAADGPVVYGLADYLEQHLTRTRRTRPVADKTWDALLAHTTRPEDLIAIADAAAARCRYTYTEKAYRAAAAASDPSALTGLGGWLERRGRHEEAEQAYRAAAAAGDDLFALRGLARWLEQRGRHDEAEQAYRAAAAAGDPAALGELGEWLERRGRHDEAEQAYRAASGGDLLELAGVAGAAGAL